jgi:hypothetical protein
MKYRNNVIKTILLAFSIFALSQITQALSPPPDGGYTGGNTAEGQSALLSLTSGLYDTAVGAFSLLSLTDGSFNTGVGAGALLANTADDNTAVGAGALLNSTTGFNNTANGAFALFSDTTGNDNAATGAATLFANTTGNVNTADGYGALANNTTGFGNTALGANAGSDLTTGDNNIDIGYNVVGLAAESNTIRIGNTDITDTFIRGISGATASGGAGVFVNANGKLGTLTSSARFKDAIKPMDKSSEAILELRPVCFHYKKEIDPQGIPQFGLVAEEVEKVNPDLVIRDTEGKPQTVRYEQIDAMLLNEFLKEHKRVEELKSTIQRDEEVIAQQEKSFESKLAQQEERIEALTSGLQKVSAQLQQTKLTRQVVLNK